MEQKMLFHNEIQGLLPCKLNVVDKKKVMEYEIDGRISMKQYLEQRQIGNEDAFYIVSGLVKTLQNLHHYLLRADGVVLDVDCIFYGEERKQVELCYLPAYEEKMIEKLKEFIELLMKHINHKEEYAVTFVYEFYELLQEPNVSLSLLENYRNSMEKNYRKQVEAEPIVIQKIDLTTKETSYNKQFYGKHDMEEEQRESTGKEMGQKEEKETNTVTMAPKEKRLRNKEAAEKGRIRNKKASEKGRKQRKREKQRNKGKDHEKKKLEQKKIVHWTLQIGSGLIGAIVLLLAISFLIKGQWKNGMIGIALLAVDCYMIFERQKSYQREAENEDRREGNKGEKEERYFKKKKREFCEEGEKTVLLSTREKQEKSIPCLQALNSNVKPIYLYHTPMILGSLEEAVDEKITGKGVSRIHASIEEESGCYYIRDLSSTNGTYWNGELLEAEVPRELKEGDNIMIGACMYEFCLMHT